MSTRTEELEREAEGTRTELDHTLDAIREKVSLGDFVDEAGRYVRESGGADMFSRLGEQIRANPVPLALAGIGIAWLMSGRGQPDVGSRLRGGRDAFGRWYHDEFDSDPDPLRSSGAYPLPTGPQGPSTTDRMRGSASHMADQASGAAHRAGDAASSAAHRAGASASSAAGSAEGYARSAYASTRDTASELASAAERYAREGTDAARRAYAAARRRADTAWRSGASAYDSAYGTTTEYGARARDGVVDAMEREPLIFGALGLALGAGIGALLPSTRTEDRWLGPARDSLRDEAVETGREQMEKARTVAEKTYESAKREAEEQGLVPGGDKPVAERLRDVADKASGTARDEAEKRNLGKP